MIKHYFCYSIISYDVVKIFDGSSLIAGPYCGSTIPPNFMSTLSSVQIKFRSDLMTVASGFQIEYSCKTIICDGNHSDTDFTWKCCTSSNPCNEDEG